MSTRELTFPLVPHRRIAGLPFGTMRSSRRGVGRDLAGSRPYRPGDDVRTIDHRVSARLSSASGRDEFVVREHLTEEAARVVIVVDRRPEMALFPEELPWLRKPAAIAAAGELIVESTLRARGLVGYLDDADGAHPDPRKRGESPFWRAPDGRTEAWRVSERYLRYGGFFAPEDCLARSFEHLVALDRALPTGSFVFVLSDFLVLPPQGLLLHELARGWDVVPVVIQDPRWEQSFPDVAGVVLPFADPATGRLSLVRLTRAEAAERRRENEGRLRGILTHFESLGLDWVLLPRDDYGSILEAFLTWAVNRREGGRRVR